MFLLPTELIRRAFNGVSERGKAVETVLDLLWRAESGPFWRVIVVGSVATAVVSVLQVACFSRFPLLSFVELADSEAPALLSSATDSFRCS